MNQGFMMAVELVSFVAFYERGFDVPSHRFLRSLLHHYLLELHNLTFLRIQHITIFVTLCETYMGIDPHFNLWNYFFRVRHPQDPDTELTICGRGDVVIHVRFGHDNDPYFDIPMPRLMKGWWKKWFYLRNDVDASLLAFADNRPVPPAFLGVWGGEESRRQATTLARGHPTVAVGRDDRRAPPADIFQSSDSSALIAGDHVVAVSEAKLSRPLLL
jgi:hypothetical protein